MYMAVSYEVLPSIAPVTGFHVASVDAGLRKQAAPDLTLIVSDRPCVAAGVFTSNRVKAAPVLIDQERITTNGDHMRAILINAACANACTGVPGLENAEKTAQWTAEALGCAPSEVFVMSTGVIGVQLPIEKFQAAIPQAAAALHPDGWTNAAHAI